MSDKADVIVIGGGLIGVTTAWELAQTGMAVTLLDAREGLALDTSFANGGMLTASMPDPWNGPGVAGHLIKSLFDPYSSMKLRLKAIPGLVTWGLRFLSNSTAARHLHATTANYILAKYSVEQTGDLIDQLKLDCDHADHGALKVFATEEAMQGPARLSAAVQEHGLAFETLTPDQILEKEPALAGSISRIAGGIHYPGDRVTDSRKFTNTLGERAKAAGVTIKQGVSVERITHANGRVSGVDTSRGHYPVSRVVVAAANHSPGLVREFGVHLPIKPAKGYSVTIPVEGSNKMPLLPVVDDAMHAALVPLGDRIRLAGTAEFTGFDRRISQERIDNLFQIFDSIYPDLAASVDRRKAEPWTAFRPMPADGKPFIGGTQVEGLYINAGHGHLGLTLAVGSAKLLASQMIGSTPAVDPTPYKIHR